jgi:PAS domain S-box-containing protein
MTMTTKKTESPQQLRQRAEELFRASESLIMESTSPEEITQLLHELRVHQIELEMQNEELRCAQADLDASQARYFDLYDLAPAGYMTITNNNMIQDVNLAAATMFGVARSLLVNEGISRVLPRESQLIFYQHLKQCIDANSAQDWDMRLVRADGDQFWAHLQVTPGQNGEYWLIINDITERKLSEEALRGSEARYRALTQSANDAIITINGDSAIVGWNLSAEGMFGYPQRFHNEHYKGFKRVQEGGKSLIIGKTLEVVGLRKDGSEFPLELSLSQWDIPTGRFYTGIIRDISARRNAEEAKLALEQQLQQAQKLESLGVLAGGIAHDFNNILCVIMSNCSLAQLQPQMTGELLPEIDKAAQRAADLCRQMLAYAGKSLMTMKQVKMTALVDDMIKMLKATINKKVIVTSDLSANIPSIRGDASQLRQIVMNLIINASEAIGEENGDIRVSLTETTVVEGTSNKDHIGKSIPVGRYVCLEVTDNGCGMDDDTRQRVFEPFYTTKFTGRGLGMSAVLGIITAHKGALQLISQQGTGTTFKVYLPVQNDESAGDSLPHVSLVPWQGSGTILLVEDEPQLSMVAKALIQALGFSVVEAANGKEALEVYQKNAEYITLVVTDIGMPIMDGYELFRKLKDMAPELPIIISSGFGDTLVSSRIATGEAAGILSKPYSFDNLREVLRGVVNGLQK